jgi:hypothetical protein
MASDAAAQHWRSCGTETTQHETGSRKREEAPTID